MSNEDPVRDDPLLTAAKLLAWRQQQSGATQPRLPEAVILTHQAFLLPKRRPLQRTPYRSLLSFDAHPGANGALTLAGVRGVGAPATAIAIEELVACGVHRLIAVDIGGSIDAAVRTGDVVLVGGALACDGTSPHYTGERAVTANEALTRRLGERLTAAGIAYTTGQTWSTDAVYRETGSQLAQARGHGAVLADMETACVLAVAGALGVEAAAVLVAADELHEAWRPPSDMSLVHARLRAALAVATACLAP